VGWVAVVLRTSAVASYGGRVRGRTGARYLDRFRHAVGLVGRWGFVDGELPR